MGQLGIVYRKDLVPQEPKRWTDLWNSSYKGHVAISSPAYSAGLQFFVGLINAQGGLESNGKDVDKAFNSLADLKNNITAYPDNPGSIQTLSVFRIIADLVDEFFISVDKGGHSSKVKALMKRCFICTKCRNSSA